mmetsp:Transcript_28459/g.77064  ORF Transcript_28459/g.77064 Transcript_28459/m.77064 type:complete len:122 (-) Transcript_28459:112-477(-)
MAMSFGRLSLVALAGCAVLAMGDLPTGAKPAVVGRTAAKQGVANKVGKENMMLQAAATMSKSDGESVDVDSAPGEKVDMCSQISSTCPASVAGRDTKGRSGIQTKTKISKVVLDLTEDDDY